MVQKGNSNEKYRVYNCYVESKMHMYKLKEKKSAKSKDKKLQKMCFSFHIGACLAGKIVHLTMGHAFHF